MEKMGKRIGSAALCLSLVFALAGCSGGEVDYGIDTETGSEEAGNTEESSRGLSQYADSDLWEDSFSVEGEYSNTPVHIAAEIEVPESESMSVVEVREPEFDEAYKEKIINTFFDEGDLYACTALPEPEDGVDTLSMEDILERGEFEPAEGYGADAYLGTRDGAEFVLWFDTWTNPQYRHSASYNERYRYILLAPRDNKDFCPEEERGAAEVFYAQSGHEDDPENACAMDKEDARELADRALSDFGFLCYEAESDGPLHWYGYGENKSLLAESSYGYAFNYTFTINGQPPTEKGSYENTFYEKSYEVAEELYSESIGAMVSVTDEGVIEIYLCNPVEITGQTRDVELLPLDNIKTLFVKELENYKLNYDVDDYQTAFRFNKLDLIYLRVKDDSRDKTYSYVPAWRLSSDVEDDNRHTYSHSFFLNAIDGSFINGPD